MESVTDVGALKGMMKRGDRCASSLTDWRAKIVAATAGLCFVNSESPPPDELLPPWSRKLRFGVKVE